MSRRRIYDAIESEYDRRRKNAYDRMLAKREEVYRKVPQLRDIDDRINKAGIMPLPIIIINSYRLAFRFVLAYFCLRSNMSVWRRFWV